MRFFSVRLQCAWRTHSISGRASSVLGHLLAALRSRLSSASGDLARKYRYDIPDALAVTLRDVSTVAR